MNKCTYNCEGCRQKKAEENQMKARHQAKPEEICGCGTPYSKHGNGANGYCTPKPIKPECEHKDFIAAKKKEWESALLEKIKEEVGNMRHYSLCHRIDAHGCSFVGKFHGTKEELAERIQAVEELLRILNNLK